MGLVKSSTGCLVCFGSTEDNVFIPTEDFQKIFNICCSYVKNAINVNYLIENITENNKKLSFCRKCVDSSLNVSQLVEQLALIKKEIIDLTTNFSESVSRRRLQTLAGEKNKTNIESYNHLIVDQHNHQIDELDIEREIVKSEKEDVITENEDIFLNLFRGEEEQNNIIVPHPLINENHNINQPIEPNLFEVNYEIVKNEKERATVEIQQIETTAPHEEEAAVIKMPHIILKRLPGHISLPARGGSKTIRGYQSGCDSGNSSIKRKSTNCTSETAVKDQLPKPKPNSKPKKGRQVRSTTCKYCFRKCSTPGTLKMHLRTHTKEKPFQCAQCIMRFSNSSNLKRHLLIHTGEKPYKCLLCDKSFIQSSDLKIHERIHTGDKPYKCSFCEITFISSTARAKHERVHHFAKKNYYM